MTTPGLLLASFGAGLLLAAVTAPVGVSGAVFLMPVQLSVLQVPSPAVTPTNLLYNVVAVPGALLRYRRAGSLRSPLMTAVLVGTIPGVVIGAVLRVFLLPGHRPFQLFVAVLLVLLGVWLCGRERMAAGGPAPRAQPSYSRRRVALLGLGVGVVGGIYGIGGGSLLSPVLIGRGLPLGIVAPAALTSTFVTSVVGAGAYVVLATLQPSLSVAPVWTVGLMAGLGGLVGGYLGATVQPRLPERLLRLVLGVLAIATGILYGVQSLS